MTYTPQPGDIGLVRISGNLGQAIRVGQFILAWLDEPRTPDDEDWANYQHAFVYLGGDDIMAAEPGGARVMRLSQYGPGEVYWCQNIGKLLSDAQRVTVVNAARQLAGTPYSYVDYLALAAHKLHLPVPGLREYIASTHHMICSQLADWCYNLAGVELFHGGWAGFVDPLDIFLLDKEFGAA